MLYPLWVILCLTQGPKDFFPMFSSWRFIVLHFAFSSMVHFEIDRAISTLFRLVLPWYIYLHPPQLAFSNRFVQRGVFSLPLWLMQKTPAFWLQFQVVCLQIFKTGHLVQKSIGDLGQMCHKISIVKCYLLNLGGRWMTFHQTSLSTFFFFFPTSFLYVWNFPE